MDGQLGKTKNSTRGNWGGRKEREENLRKEEEKREGKGNIPKATKKEVRSGSFVRRIGRENTCPNRWKLKKKREEKVNRRKRKEVFSFFSYLKARVIPNLLKSTFIPNLLFWEI